MARLSVSLGLEISRRRFSILSNFVANFDVLIAESVLHRRIIVFVIVRKILSGKYKNTDVEEEIYGHRQFTRCF